MEIAQHNDERTFNSSDTHGQSALNKRNPYSAGPAYIKNLVGKNVLSLLNEISRTFDSSLVDIHHYVIELAVGVV